MLKLPAEVVCGGILPHLYVCELQALDNAFTNKYLRPQLRQLWKCYPYASTDNLSYHELRWLCDIGVEIVEVKYFERPAKAEQGLGMLARMPSLRQLNCMFATDVALQKLAVGCPLLEMISLSAGGYSDVGISALAKNCTQLQNVYLRCNEITDISVTALAENCHQLHTFCIISDAVTDAGIQALCDNCPHMKDIGISSYGTYITDASLIAIGNTYPHIRSITLCCKKFTDDALIFLADKCHELRSVNIWGGSFTGRGLTTLWAANANIIEVDLKSHYLLSDNDVTQLAECCPLLQKLNVSYCANITDAAVIAVAERCPQLRSLNICESFKKKLCDTSLIAIGQHCHQLRSIDASWLYNISDVGIAALAAGCPLLQELSAISTKVTDVGVIALARSCPDLRKIELNYCNSVGCPAVSAIAENCLSCTFINVRM